ncbi:MAG TPA: hypothetical protein VH373_03840 [Jatrophihabitantaceae bacterium]
MAWLVGLVWGIAVLTGFVVLGLCAWDLAGKVKRLRKDADGLRTLRDQLIDLQAQVADAQRRVPTLRSISGR